MTNKAKYLLIGAAFMALVVMGSWLITFSTVLDFLGPVPGERWTSSVETPKAARDTMSTTHTAGWADLEAKGRIGRMHGWEVMPIPLGIQARNADSFYPPTLSIDWDYFREHPNRLPDDFRHVPPVAK